MDSRGYGKPTDHQNTQPLRHRTPLQLRRKNYFKLQLPRFLCRGRECYPWHLEVSTERRALFSAYVDK